MSPSAERLSILVVDDDPDIMKMLPVHLDQWGYRPLTAQTAEQGLAMAAAHRPALILLDMLMPKMKGREFCQRLRQAPETAPIPVIFLTALGHDDYVRAGFEAGAEDYVTKPFDPAYLRERIRVCLLKQASSGSNA